MIINPIKVIHQIIDDIRYSLNDPNSKFNNCSELEQQLRELEKQLQDSADILEAGKDGEKK